ncbi:uncharacterized protein METZ01_LOCUS421691, partial [marine metagenome]
SPNMFESIIGKKAIKQIKKFKMIDKGDF